MPRKKIEPEETVCVQFVEGGFTHAGAVWREGSVTVMPASLGSLSPRTQKKRWGQVMFEEISDEEYEEITGHPPAEAVDGKVAAAARTGRPVKTKAKSTPSLGGDSDTPEPNADNPEGAAFLPSMTHDTEPFAGYSDASADETLEAVATMNDVEVEHFVAYERSHRNRDDVLAAVVPAGDDDDDVAQVLAAVAPPEDAPADDADGADSTDD